MWEDYTLLDGYRRRTNALLRRTQYRACYFYFSFSDSNKQTLHNLLSSLVVQLGGREPGLSMLRQAYERPDRRLPGMDETHKIILSSIATNAQVFLHLDGLDEYPESDGVRGDVLEWIEGLLRQAPNLSILITSRDVPDIHGVMEIVEADSICIAAQTVNADIQRYVSTQMLRDQKLSRLDCGTEELVAETLARKADGM